MMQTERDGKNTEENNQNQIRICTHKYTWVSVNWFFTWSHLLSDFWWKLYLITNPFYIEWALFFPYLYSVQKMRQRVHTIAARKVTCEKSDSLQVATLAFRFRISKSEVACNELLNHESAEVLWLQRLSQNSVLPYVCHIGLRAIFGGELVPK